MHIILFRNRDGKSGTTRLGRGQVLSVLLLAVSLPLATAYLGYHLGSTGRSVPGDGQDWLPLPQAELQTWRQELQFQRFALDALRDDQQARTETLAARVAQIQAQIMRLDALGERLTKLADLEEGEFDFSESPPQGGPVVQDNLDPEGLRDLGSAIDELALQVDDRERQLQLLSDLLLDRNLAAETRPTGRPVKSGWISSGYGRRTDPITGKRSIHEGIDFAGKSGADILAVASGVVVFAGDRDGYGLLVEIDHGNGLSTRYGHNSKLLVKEGEVVKQGQTIALLGSTGRSTGPHVHFEVLRDGRHVNPARYLRSKG
ncbi:MAG: M23 family metallopeptidase [Gammaproteobacteria bacterium]|nr:M23 family metallopeptidase [Gammaproteobacteria bacterium]